MMSKRNYAQDAEAHRDIIEVGRRMYQKGFANANDGNISVRVSKDTVWATPTGVSKGFMTPDMLVLLDLDGNVLHGKSKPSSEIKMHLAVYKNSQDARAVTHAHPPIATTFAAAGIPLDKALLQETVVLLGVIPLAQYALPGSDALAQSIVPFVQDYNGALLEHHGAVSWGKDAMQAFFRLESIEYTAMVTMYSRMMGITRPLMEEQIDELMALRPAWGVTGGGRPVGRGKDDEI